MCVGLFADNATVLLPLINGWLEWCLLASLVTHGPQMDHPPAEWVPSFLLAGGRPGLNVELTSI